MYAALLSHTGLNGLVESDIISCILPPWFLQSASRIVFCTSVNLDIFYPPCIFAHIQNSKVSSLAGLSRGTRRGVPCNNPRKGCASSRDWRRAPRLQVGRVLSDNGDGVFNCPKVPTVRRRGVSCVLCIVGLYNRCIAPAPAFSFQGVALDPVRGAGLVLDAPAVRPAGVERHPARRGGCPPLTLPDYHTQSTM